MKRRNRRKSKGLIVFTSESRGREECMSMGMMDSKIASKCNQVLSPGVQLPKVQHTVITGCPSINRSPRIPESHLSGIPPEKRVLAGAAGCTF